MNQFDTPYFSTEFILEYIKYCKNIDIDLNNINLKIENIAINPHTTCNVKENHALVGNNPIAINTAALKFSPWYNLPFSIFALYL